MAVLDATSRTDAKSKFIQAFFSGLRNTADLDDVEVGQLVSDIDDWLDANSAAANTAIRVAVRTKASSATKFAALAYVAMKRSGLI